MTGAVPIHSCVVPRSIGASVVDRGMRFALKMPVPAILAKRHVIFNRIVQIVEKHGIAYAGVPL